MLFLLKKVETSLFLKENRNVLGIVYIYKIGSFVGILMVFEARLTKRAMI